MVLVMAFRMFVRVAELILSFPMAMVVGVESMHVFMRGRGIVYGMMATMDHVVHFIRVFFVMNMGIFFAKSMGVLVRSFFFVLVRFNFRSIPV
jgi:hypothetical protein